MEFGNLENWKWNEGVYDGVEMCAGHGKGLKGGGIQRKGFLMCQEHDLIHQIL